MKTVGLQGLRKLKNHLARIANSDAFSIISVVSIFFVLYGKALNFFFYSDDFHHLLVNSNLSIRDAFSYGTQVYSNLNLYRPTTNIYYIINYNLFGTSPFPYFLQLFIFGLLTAILLYFVIYHLSNNRFLSLFSTIIYVSLPFHIDPISWPANICDNLLGFFSILSIFSLLLYKKNEKIFFLALCFFATVMALLSKEPAVGLIFPLSLIIFYSDHSSIIKNIKLFVIIFLPFVAYFFNRISYSSYIKEVGSTPSYKMPIAENYYQYLESLSALFSKIFLLPDNFAINPLFFLFVFGVVILLLYIATNNAHKKMYLLGISLLVFITLPSITVEYYFDRYVYASALGIPLVFASLVLSAKKNKIIRNFLIASGVFIFVYSSSLTLQRLKGTEIASSHSKKFVSSMKHADEVSELHLVPVVYEYKIFGRYVINNLIISEKSHPTSIRKVFYGADSSIDVMSTVRLNQESYTIKLSGNTIIFKGAESYYFIDNKISDDFTYYYNGNRILGID